MDIGWSELLVIGVVALIVIGPKDLPGLFKTLGRMTGKVRRMAREFQRAMEDAADETGVRETAADLKKMTSPSKLGLDKLNEAADRFEKWDPAKAAERAKTVGEQTAKMAEERAAKAKAAKEAAAAKKAETSVEKPTEEKPETSA